MKDSISDNTEFGRIKESLKIVFPRTTSAESSDTNTIAWALIDTLEALSASANAVSPNTDSISIRSILEHAICGGHTLGKGELEYEELDAEIDKINDQATAQLLQLLESKAVDVTVRSQPMPGSVHGSYTYKAIPLSAIKGLRSK